MAKVYKDPRMRNAAGKAAWCLLYKGLDRKWHRERTDALTRDQAEGLLRRRLGLQSEAEARGLQTLDHVKPMPFSEFYKDTYLPYLEAHTRESTVTTTRYLAKHVLPHFGALPLRAISAGDIEEYRTRRLRSKPRPSNRTVNMEKGLVSRVLNHAYRKGLVDANEAGRVEDLPENARDVWLTQDDVDRILEVAEDWVKPFVVLAVHTGMRREELCSLQWGDLEHSPGLIRIGEESKTGIVRYIPRNSIVEAVLDAQKRRRLADGNLAWVIPNKRLRKGYTGNAVYHAFKRATELAAKRLKAQRRTEDAERLEAATFHSTRHSFASWLIQAGVPERKVQQYLGHQSDVMTRLYTHMAPAGVEDRGTLEMLVSGDHCANVAQESCAGTGKVVNS